MNVEDKHYVVFIPYQNIQIFLMMQTVLQRHKEDVVEKSLDAWEKLMGEKRKICNTLYHFMAYKQYIWWIYGKLGKDFRMCIPTCVLYKMQYTYSDPNNIYFPFSMT